MKRQRQQPKSATHLSCTQAHFCTEAMRSTTLAHTGKEQPDLGSSVARHMRSQMSSKTSSSLPPTLHCFSANSFKRPAASSACERQGRDFFFHYQEKNSAAKKRRNMIKKPSPVRFPVDKSRRVTIRKGRAGARVVTGYRNKNTVTGREKRSDQWPDIFCFGADAARIGDSSSFLTLMFWVSRAAREHAMRMIFSVCAFGRISSSRICTSTLATRINLPTKSELDD